MICDVSLKEYDILLHIWEMSVRATHAFLSEDDLQEIKQQLIGVYFAAVELKCIKSSHGEVLGFSGVSDQKLEMLFVLPAAQGQGVGSSLCQFAIDNQGVQHVDVNEQNPRALKFYEKMGFEVVGRDEVDGEGRAYPVLHLSLIDKTHE